MRRIEYAAIMIPVLGLVAVIAAFLGRDPGVAVVEKPRPTAVERLESLKEAKVRQIKYEERQNAQKMDQAIKDLLARRNEIKEKNGSRTPEDLGEFDGFELHYIFEDRVSQSTRRKLMDEHDDSKVHFEHDMQSAGSRAWKEHGGQFGISNFIDKYRTGVWKSWEYINRSDADRISFGREYASRIQKELNSE